MHILNAGGSTSSILRRGCFPLHAAVCLSIGLATCFAAEAQQGSEHVTSVPSVSGPIPISAKSRIYMAAADARVPLDLPALGYQEEEYFFSGKANVYDWARSGAVTVHTPDAPYTTRMLVRRPTDPARFSGTVWVEFLNSVARIDEAMAWGYSNYYMMDHGDAYVGISVDADGDALATLKRFDPQRYASLSMANPAPLPAGCAAAGKNDTVTAEPGLRWDMLSQAGALLKSDLPGRPLASLPVQRVFLFGQSNGDLPTYLAAFGPGANLPGGKPVWDGYLVKDSGVPIQVSQCDERPGQDDARRVLHHVGSPVIQLVVENTVANNAGSRRPDSDAVGDRYRRYEIPGASHVDPYVHLWLPRPEILAAVGIPALWPQNGCYPRGNMSDFPIHYYVSGAMANLDAWVRSNVSPPHAPWIETTGTDAKNMKLVQDLYGHARGGVRNAYVEVPTDFVSSAASSCESVDRAGDWKQLEARYGTFAAYQTRWNEAVAHDIQNHWVPEAYAGRLKAGLIDMPTAEQEKKPTPARHD